MAKYLIETTETYRVDTEGEATELIENAKNDAYLLAKYSSVHKQKMAKGEVVDEYYKVTLTRSFTDIKAPEADVRITYSE